MEVRVSVEAGDLLSMMRKGEQSVRYAAANALNATVKRAQKLERDHVKSLFTLRPRGGDFVVRQAAIIKPFASASRANGLSTTMRVGTPNRLILSQFEGGEPKMPQPGRKAVAIPIKARPAFASNVPASLFITRLRLHNKGQQIVGSQRTFQIRGVGVLQQQPGPARPILLYIFRPQAKLDRRLRFVPIALTTVPFFYSEFEREVQKAIAFKFEHYGERAFTP